jgi:predicted GH43/DUF377 family glycosyl hydrolase
MRSRTVKRACLMLGLMLLMPALGLAEEQMMYRDTSRVGVPFAKDPVVVNFGHRYLMYYSIPPRKGQEGAGWNIGLAERHDLTNWERIGELTPEQECERKGLCAPGALVRKDTVHLFYQTYGNGRKDAICHAWSTDGKTFHRDPSNPIFQPTGLWHCGRAIDAEVCYYKGRYLLYFATRDPEFERQMLGVAEAPEGTDFSRGQWTMACDESILKPELPWEQKCIEGATVIRRGRRLFMFYAGAYNNAPQQIGVAVSRDGIHWERLSDKPFLPNGRQGEWNESESGHPCIFKDKTGRTHLFFQGNASKGQDWYISRIGVKWKKGRPIPVLQGEE